MYVSVSIAVHSLGLGPRTRTRLFVTMTTVFETSCVDVLFLIVKSYVFYVLHYLSTGVDNYSIIL